MQKGTEQPVRVRTHIQATLRPTVNLKQSSSPVKNSPDSLVPSPAASTLQGQAPDGSFANRHGRHAVGHADDFKALQQQILEGSALLHKMEASLYSFHQVRHPPTQSSTSQQLTEVCVSGL